MGRTVSAEAVRVQGVENTEGMEELPGEADRALAIVADKLDNKLSVEYSVNSLIREATDPENLCRVFAGESCPAVLLSFFIKLFRLRTDLSI